MSTIILILLGLFAILCFFLVYKLFLLKSSIPLLLNKAREDALNKQRAVIKGQIGEQMTPHLKGFPYSPSDCKFFGNSFDYVVISNMAEARDSDEEVKEIVILDVKTGKAQLSKTQKKIRDCIVRGDVYWETITVDNGEVTKIDRAVKLTDWRELIVLNWNTGSPQGNLGQILEEDSNNGTNIQLDTKGRYKKWNGFSLQKNKDEEFTQKDLATVDWTGFKEVLGK